MCFPKSVLYTMLFTAVAHPMGLNCCSVNVDFKTFSQFVSSFLLLSHPELYDHGAGIWATVEALPFQLASSQVNSNIISSSDVLWSAAPPGLLLFWIYLSIFQLAFNPSTRSVYKRPAVSSMARFILYVFPWKTTQHGNIEYYVQPIWQTLRIFSMHCSSCGIYFPSITVWNNVLLFNWSPWLRCFFGTGSNPFIKACTLCVKVSLYTEAKLLITLVQRAGDNLYIYFQMLSNSEETFFTIYTLCAGCWLARPETKMAKMCCWTAPLHQFKVTKIPNCFIFLFLFCNFLLFIRQLAGSSNAFPLYELYLPWSASACFSLLTRSWTNVWL